MRDISVMKGAQLLVGGMVGAGIFGLPYAIFQAGLGIGIVELVGIGVMHTVLFLALSDMIINTPGNPRLSGVIEFYLGKHWAWLAGMLFFLSACGALLAYVILGGTFAHAVFSSVLPASVTFYQYGFFCLASFFLVGGIGIISRMESWFVPFFFLVICIIGIVSLPFVQVKELTTFYPEQAAIPFGVILFALAGFGIVPELSALPRDHRKILHHSIVLGNAAVILLYALFACIVIAVSGAHVTQDAFGGLAPMLGNGILIAGSTLGMLSVFSGFLLLGTEVINMLTVDYKKRFLLSWGITILVPLIPFVAGMRDFVSVIGWIGGVFGGILGLILLRAYLAAKRHTSTPKRCMNIPDGIIYLCGVVYLIGIFVTIF
jgi:tyrosine-specific transport protein